MPGDNHSLPPSTRAGSRRSCSPASVCRRGYMQNPAQDVVFQYTRKSGAGTIKARQVVPGMHWEVVPSPVVEVCGRMGLSGVDWAVLWQQVPSPVVEV